MRKHLEHVRRYLAHTPRIFAALLGSLALCLSMAPTVYATSVVTVTDSDGASYTVLTASDAPHEIIEMVGLTTEHTDEIVYDEGASSIVIRYAFPVYVEADGEIYTAEFVEGTVEDLLAKTGVALDGEDFTQPALEDELHEGLTVQVNRVTYSIEELREQVSEELVDAYVAALLPEEGEDAPTFTRSNAGIYDVVYHHRYVNGTLESSEILELFPVLQPRDEGSTEFLDGVPCSTIEGFDGVTLSAEGVPNEYTRVIEGAVATAYSSSGGKGASGLGLFCGTVAVDPAKIPYGTRLYITSADNSFVYGYAIATDTGTAMREGHVDIDLYFETNAECLRFGKRTLNVYVLD